MTYPRSQTKPWQHQVDAMGLVERHRGVGLWLDMGAGKSKVVVDHVVDAGYLLTLIVCPHAVIDVWPEQFKTHGAEPINVLPLAKGTTKKRAEKLKEEIERAKLLKRPLVAVTNYESAWRGDLGKLIKSNVWGCIVADEAHRIKSAAGRASRFLWHVGKTARKRLGLSGTPMPHSPLDAYAVYRFLNDQVFPRNKALFLARYAVMGGFENREVRQWINQEDFTRRFRSISMSVAADDVLDLPDERDVWLWCDLERNARRVYDELRREAIAQLGPRFEDDIIEAFVRGDTASASNVLVKALRLQQITSGHIVDDGGATREVSTAKRELLASLLLDMRDNEPVVVFCRFRADLDAVHDVAHGLARRSMELSGSRNDYQRWRQHGAAPILAAQIQAGGIGVDLTRARYAVYYSMGWSLGDYRQSRARIRRPGQGRPVIYYHLGARSSVDVTLRRALESRAALVKAWEGRE